MNTALWAGIDEAGYGPNLGPLVMTAVVAEGERPDLWRDCAATVGRAGADPKLLWVDDSKRLYHSGNGLDRLNAATLATLEAIGTERPRTFRELLQAVAAGSLDDAELSPWLDPGSDPMLDGFEKNRAWSAPLLDGARWRIVAVRSVVVGPGQFNRGLDRTGSKAVVHFSAFARLLDWLWNETRAETFVTSDKHGGRHFYLEPLVGEFPGVWIDRGPEGPALSRYLLRDATRRLELSLQPRADAADGLVALASLVSKTLREHWMAAFNAHWQALVPGLRPTAGYPADAHRFRTAIEPLCQARGLEPDQWWRKK